MVTQSGPNARHRFDNDLRYREADHPNNTQFTPDYVLDPVRECLGGGIELDPCSTEDNPTRASFWFCPPQDGLLLPWYGATVFVNPPYGKAREPWVKRCIIAAGTGCKVVLLIPAHTDTRIFQEAASSATGIVFIKGRVKFGTLRPNRRQVAASHPSCLIGWNVDLSPAKCLGVML